MVVYAVVYSNYEPPEVDSLWITRELAENRIEELSKEWNIIEWTVGTDKNSEVLSNRS